MPATETGETSGKTTFRIWPKSPKNPQQPLDPGHESLRKYISAQSLFVVLGIINGDFERPLIIQTWSNIPHVLSAGETIAHLLLLPFNTVGSFYQP